MFLQVQSYRISLVFQPDFLFSFPTYVMAMVSDADAKNYDFSSVKQLLTAGVVISSAMVDKIMQLSHLERILNVRKMKLKTKMRGFTGQKSYNKLSIMHLFRCTG